MSDAMPDTASIVALPMFKRVTRMPHKFPPCEGFKRVPQHESQSGFEQVERKCVACRLVKITVMRATAPRAYRWGDGCQFEDDVDPDCPGMTEAKAS